MLPWGICSTAGHAWVSNSLIIFAGSECVNCRRFGDDDDDNDDGEDDDCELDSENERQGIKNLVFYLSLFRIILKLTFAGSMIIMNSPQKVEFDRPGERSPEQDCC